MKIVIFTFLCANLANGEAEENKPSSLEGKIIGGRCVEKIEERPYVVSLRVNGTHFGIATLISTRDALTAGEIVYPYISQNHDYKELSVVTGTLNPYGEGIGEPNPIAYIEVHPEFLRKPFNTSPFNIALVGLLYPIVSSPFTVKAIEQYISFTEEYAFLVGWGYDYNSSDSTFVTYSSQLREIPLKILMFFECLKLFTTEHIDYHPSHMCAKPIPGLGEITIGNSAKGDIGGPLLYDRTFLGIYIHRNYNTLYSPSMYIKIIEHRHFIARAKQYSAYIRLRKARNNFPYSFES